LLAPFWLQWLPVQARMWRSVQYMKTPLAGTAKLSG
jgi:hypothetical protein